MSGKIKKACLAMSLAALVGVSAGVSACGTSKHPNARITIEFNGAIYEVDYTLYRNMYPQTVQHFIELADSGFYNDTIIHDYRSTDWVAGAYDYNRADEEGNVSDYSAAFSRSALGEYLEFNCKESEYYELVTEGIKNGNFSASVYADLRYDSKGNMMLSIDDALPTVIGEFSDNGHKIEDDKGLIASYGTLKMFYYSKDVKPVFVKDSFDAIMPRDYNYNCATSLFSMQMKDSSTIYNSNKYAVFGQLKNNKARDVLEELTDAIADYAAELGSTTKWSMSVQTQVDKLDKFADDGGIDIDATFTMVSMPIIIRSVKITKY